jgi:hypothetical protein
VPPTADSPSTERLTLHGKTIATHISSSFATLQLADAARAILHPQRWLVYASEAPVRRRTGLCRGRLIAARDALG